MFVNCKLCIKLIQIGKCKEESPRISNSICCECFNDRTKTKTTVEVEFGDYDIKTLTKLYHKNYIMYSCDECSLLDKCDVELTNADIIKLKESPNYYNSSEKERFEIITQIDPNIDDRYAQIFISYGLHQHHTDEEFFDYLKL
jgi:hypothetical protein